MKKTVKFGITISLLVLMFVSSASGACNWGINSVVNNDYRGFGVAEPGDNFDVTTFVSDCGFICSPAEKPCGQNIVVDFDDGSTASCTVYPPQSELDACISDPCGVRITDDCTLAHTYNQEGVFQLSGILPSPFGSRPYAPRIGVWQPAPSCSFSISDVNSVYSGISDIYNVRVYADFSVHNLGYSDLGTSFLGASPFFMYGILDNVGTYPVDPPYTFPSRPISFPIMCGATGGIPGTSPGIITQENYNGNVDICGPGSTPLRPGTYEIYMAYKFPQGIRWSSSYNYFIPCSSSNRIFTISPPCTDSCTGINNACRNSGPSNSHQISGTCCTSGQECYACNTDYTWNGASCAYTGCTDSCTGINNACRNSGPSNSHQISGTCCTSGQECYACNTDYTWNGASCAYTGCTESCTGINNACRNSGPSNSHQISGTCCTSGQECYACNTDYTWNGASCAYTGCTDSCTGINNACRNSGPSNSHQISGTCCTSGQECYACNTGYFWDGTSCAASCVESCLGIDNRCLAPQPSNSHIRSGTCCTSGDGCYDCNIGFSWDPSRARCTAPPEEPTVLLTPTNPSDPVPLTCDSSTVIDPDGGSVTYHYQWEKDGVIQPALSLSLPVSSYTILVGGVAGIDYDQKWRCYVQAEDNEGDLTANVASNQVTIPEYIPPNLAPDQPEVDVVPAYPPGPYPNDDLLCIISTPSTDPEGDPVQYKYEWFQDGNPTSYAKSYSSDLTHQISPVSAIGEIWRCEVTPRDDHSNVGPMGWDEIEILDPAFYNGSFNSKTETDSIPFVLYDLTFTDTSHDTPGPYNWDLNIYSVSGCVVGSPVFSDSDLSLTGTKTVSGVNEGDVISLGTVVLEPLPDEVCGFLIDATTTEDPTVSVPGSYTYERRLMSICPSCTIKDIPTVLHPLGIYSADKLLAEKAKNDAESAYHTADLRCSAMMPCPQEAIDKLDLAEIHVEAAKNYYLSCNTGEVTCRLTQYYAKQASSLVKEANQIMGT